MKQRYAVPLLAVTSFALLVSFYLFSRFTVDDAFITWRYGKNFIEHGVWGYNPTTFDLTQAYTNPIYALASILPAAVGGDVVLFFKVISLLLVGGFLVFFCRLSENKILGLFLGLLFIALPASMVHAFSGLETFLYVAALGFLLIAIVKSDLRTATLLSALLILTRPEAWLLIGLVPAYFFLGVLLEARKKGEGLRGAFHWDSLKPVLCAQAFLALFFGAYAAFHYLYFGDVLPNTFYVKSNAPFNFLKFAFFSFFLLPTLALIPAGHKRVLLFVLLLFVPIVYTYSTSPLQMNYIVRFPYHLFAPIYILCAWLAVSRKRAEPKSEGAGSGGEEVAPERGTTGGAWSMTAIPLAFLAVFLLMATKPADLIHVMNYYPRELQANAVLGKSLADLRMSGAVRSFSYGDAGVVAFQSGMVALDNIGLGSSLVAHNGVTEDVIDSYAPDVIIFHSRPGRIRLEKYGQSVLLRWAKENQYRYLCEVFLGPNYTLRIYTVAEMSDLSRACDLSQRKNNLSEVEFLRMHLLTPPWQFWRE